MADEADVQETVNDTVDTPAGGNPAPEPGGDVQATETENPVGDTDPNPEPEKPVEKTYDEKYVKKLRDEAAAARVKGKEAAEQAAKEAAEKAQKELVEQIGRITGLIKDDTPTDPAELLKAAQEREQELAAERDAAAEKLRNYARKDAISAAAKATDGDLESILDSRKVISKIEKLDTNADDFAAQVAAIVSDAVESNPKLKQAPAQAAAPRSGGDLSGGNAAPKPRGPKSVDDIRRAKREARERDGF
ncbi:hypothetical protein [Nocardia otitidiscaviarum]|uniref:hypothetical protein n=1 Tax=Nocardia otitidiscaviarum TaxID=1823 RepID=UPI003CC7C60C